MPNLRSKTWTTTTPAYAEDAQYWEDHLISDADAAKIGTVILPAGGTAGQVLTKQSSTANDATWEDPASSGHTIVDEDDTDMPYRTNLQFLNADVTDDSANDATVVDCKGAKGDPGQAATITVGTVTTLPAGSNATVTNTGTSSAAVFDFGIPKGADGSGAGDMLKADYDPNSVVELAGGIPDYFASQAYTLPTAASNVLGGVKVGTNLSIDANGVLSATDTNTDTLHDLTDVNISLPSDGQALLYDSASSKWVNGDVAGSASATVIDLSNIVTPSALVEIVYAGIVLKLGMATLYLRVKALSDFTGNSGVNIITGVPYIPISFDHRNMEIIGRNITQGNIGVMGWYRGDTGYEGDIDIAVQTMVGVNHHKDDVISMSITYIYREVS